MQQTKTTKQAAMLIITFVFAMGVKAQNLDDGFKPEANDWVRALVQQSNGGLLVGGRFTQMTNGIARTNLARLRADGSIDPNFNPILNGEVVDIGIQHDNKIIITGGFTQVNGVTRNRIARLNPDGSLDMDFDPNADAGVWAMEIQPDGRIVIAGSFTTVGGQPHIRIARLLENGQLDPEFDAGAGAEGGAVVSLHIQPSGDVVIGGYFTTIDGLPLARIARLSRTGVVDSAFTISGGANNAVWAIQEQSDGRLLLGGQFTVIQGGNRNYMARIHANGELDDEFFTETDGHVLDIAINSDEDILIAGRFTQVNGVDLHRVAKLNFSGFPSQFFGGDLVNYADDDVDVITIQQDGKVVIGGLFTQSLGQARIRLARFYANGYLDDSLGNVLSQTDPRIQSVIETSQGHTLIGGRFRLPGSGAEVKLIQLHADGTLDTDFNPDLSTLANVRSIVQLSDGSVMVSGLINNSPAPGVYKIIRLLLDGSIDATFDVTANGNISGITRLPNVGILVHGSFTVINGVAQPYLALLTDNGAIIDDFDVEINGPVRTAAADPNANRFVIGGNFTEVNQFSRPHLARLLLVGQTPFVDSFDPTVDGIVTAAAVQPDGKVIIGGFFNLIDLIQRRGLARLNADGSVDASLNLGLSGGGRIDSIALQTNGSVLLGGNFSSVGASPRSNFARLRRNLFNGNQMQVDNNFIINTNAAVNTVSVQQDGKVMLGGLFTAVGNDTMPGVARLSQTTAALQSLTIGTDSLKWKRSGASPEIAGRPIAIVNGQISEFIGLMDYTGDGWSIPLNFDVVNNTRYIFRIFSSLTTGSGNGSSYRIEQVKQQVFTDLIFNDGFE